jgi:sugar phosphate isomerase/epimerase
MSNRSIDRRAFLHAVAGSTVAVGAAAMAAPGAAAQTRGGRLIPRANIGIQLWSVRDKVWQLGFATVFEELSRMGYREVEFAGYDQFEVGPITPEEIRRLLDENGLKGVSSHRPIDDFRNDLERHLDIAQTLGLRYLGTPEAPTGGFGTATDRTAAGYRAAAEQFNEWGAAAAARGIGFFQHNHCVEFSFATDDPRVRLYDVFLRHTDPRFVFLQMDILWAYGGARQYPGFRPVDYVKANPRRYPMFHLKDGVPLSDPMRDNSYLDVEFGQGVIPYEEFFSELRGRERYRYLWEQDTGPDVLPNPPGSLGAAERSYGEIVDLRSCR